jgi:COP9 signalosome complex subunit 7
MGPAVLVDLIKRALDAKGVYNFADFLDQVEVKVREDTEMSQSPQVTQWVTMLRIYAFGTWQDYASLGPSSIELSRASAQKLKILSLVTMARTSRLVGYDQVQSEVQVSGDRQVERLFMEAVSSGVVAGQIYSSRRLLDFTPRIGRDVNPERLKQIEQILANHINRVTAVRQFTHNITQQTESAGIARSREISEFSSAVSEIVNPQ